MAAKMEMDVKALNTLDFGDDSNVYSLAGPSLLLASINQTKIKLIPLFVSLCLPRLKVMLYIYLQ